MATGGRCTFPPFICIILQQFACCSLASCITARTARAITAPAVTILRQPMCCWSCFTYYKLSHGAFRVTVSSNPTKLVQSLPEACPTVTQQGVLVAEGLALQLQAWPLNSRFTDSSVGKNCGGCTVLRKDTVCSRTRGTV